MVAPKGSRRQAAIDQDHGNVLTRCGVEEVRPQLGLLDNQGTWTQTSHHTPHKPGQIKRQHKYTNGLRDDTLGYVFAGRCKHRQHNREFRHAGMELGDNRTYPLYLSHRSGVKP